MCIQRNYRIITWASLTKDLQSNFYSSISDEIYSKCLQPTGSLTNGDLEETEQTIHNFCTTWRSAGMPLMIKFHIIEKHLVPMFLCWFRGLKEYDKSFIERAHQLSKKLEQKSSNVKSMSQRHPFITNGAGRGKIQRSSR